MSSEKPGTTAEIEAATPSARMAIATAAGSRKPGIAEPTAQAAYTTAPMATSKVAIESRHDRRMIRLPIVERYATDDSRTHGASGRTAAPEPSEPPAADQRSRSTAAGSAPSG